MAGATAEEVEPLLLEPEGVEIAGQVDDDEKWRLLGEADLLCAPSLGGESFGMVLTEAFASGTPSWPPTSPATATWSRDGGDSVLVPVGDAVALGEALRALAFDPARRSQMAEAARERAERFAWPNVAREVTEVYEQALEVPQPEGRVARVAQRGRRRQPSPARAWPARLRRSSRTTRRRPPPRGAHGAAGRGRRPASCSAPA